MRIFILKYVWRFKLKKANKGTGSIQSITRYIDDQCLNADISLKSVADRFNVTTPYLCRYYKEKTGWNFTEYISRKRIMEAKRLMSDRNLSLEEISNRIGYDNILTFRRAFKKYAGVVPSEYRSSLCIDDL